MMRALLLLVTMLLCVGSLAHAAQPVRYQLVSNLNIPPDLLIASEKNPWRDTTLRIGIISENTSPYNIIVDDDLYGLNADYLGYVQQVTGIHFQIYGFSDLAKLEQALHDGTVDLVYGIPQNEALHGLKISQPYYVSNLRVLRDRSNDRKVMLNSANARVAISTLTDMQAGNALKTVSSHVQRYDNNLQAVYALLNGSSDYFIADEASASFIIDQLQLGQLYQIESTLNLGNLSFVFAAANPALIETLNVAIADTPMELMNAIQSRWSKKIPSYLDTGNADLTQMEKSWVKTHPTVYYAAIENNFPFAYRGSGGQARGYAIDILNIIAQNTGLRFVPLWARNAEQADQLVQSGQASFRTALPLARGVKARYSASMPIHRSLWGVYVGQHDNGISTWSDLAGKRIGVLQGDLAQGLVPANEEQIRFADSKAMYDALANGQLDALVDNVISANFVALSRYSGAIKLAFAANNIAYPVAFGVRQDQPLLLAILDKNLMQIPSETLQSLRDEWIVDRSNLIDAVNENRMQPQTTWLLALLAAAILLLLGLTLRRFILQRRDKREREVLEQARRHAEAENRMKSKFLATVSHELRTPMHAILGLLELELKRQPTPEGLPVIYSSASSLLNLLNDLQDHARLATGSLTLAPKAVALHPWVAHISALYRPLIGERPVTLNVSAADNLPAAVLIDGERLLQVANNLINNAIKFTPRGSIQVSIGWREQSAPLGELLLTVTDSGCGIAADEIGKLFQPFYRARGAQRVSVQGTGLGLSICKEIIEQMGGRIELHSRLGVGTEVSLSVPVTEVALDSATQQTDKPLNLPPPSLRVALIDDHPTNLLLMERQLRHFGLQPTLFEQGYPLLKAHRRQPFDLLFIDYNMPRPDGLTLARLIRRDEQRHRRPACQIILCSADVQEFTRIPPELVAIDRFLTKPISLDALAQALPQQPQALEQQLVLTDLQQSLADMAGNDRPMIQRLATTLLTTLQQDRQRLALAAQSEDWLQLGQAAHRIKGSLLMLQLPAAASLCQQLVESGREGTLLQDAYTELSTLVEQILIELDDLVSANESYIAMHHKDE
ncbi:ATP-binding protein [Serratia liquefaciens]|uniref:ATP-binding protein n=1 Tax=Serratia liquefaciens TaxID=614 RepID=UPI0021795FCE|nr:transporter substrate-binding domain-containing protein [Serratia liquefaciens]CAI0949056.1 Virulence sensor protein BvgS precursor [Serratia liquefaciens]CAI2110811.1 Virulence sensor protein BvgS precursor [Serratia liquefaciens]CAI2463449.1 Virulence sensor protein BvgS precursor [Serratia liquefaciens]HBL6730111.1 transporter substrate-binding domain-containing protein [Serratia liquefaciens]HEJ7998652.1 transporter substrate-binding domain-containing protein [Serratia liquefaciens]